MKSGLSERIRFAIALAVIIGAMLSLPGSWRLGVRVALAATVTVNSTTDVSDGDTSSIANLIATPGPDLVISLREAITAANNTAGADIIDFNIPDTGVQTISVISPLPAITETLTINGLSQPGAAFGSPRLRLTSLNPGSGDGFLIAASTCIIRGFAIDGFNTGILINGGSGNRIEANLIGTDPSGTAPAPNTIGVVIQSPSTNNIVGTNGDQINDGSEGNLISGNERNGVRIENSTGNRVSGNRVGTNFAGTDAIPNVAEGVLLTGSTNSNIVGTNGDGIADADEDNLISGNSGAGLFINGSSTPANLNRVAGNRIGTDLAGTAAISNNGGGVVISGVIASGNIIGTDGDGSAGDAAEGNLISGNSQANLLILEGAPNNRAAGNLIGPAADGLSLVTGRPAGCVGVRIEASNNVIGTNNDGSADAIEGNLISGNTSDGVVISDNRNNNTVAGNMIGTDSSGAVPLPNAGSGVLLSHAADNNIGGTSAVQRNIISGNSQQGVLVLFGDSTGNRILGNSIFSNGGLGIALDTDGVTPNDSGDPDSGPNNFQNFPVITNVSQGSTIVDFTLNSTANRTFRVEFFSSITPDPTGFGEGQTFIGFQNVTTDGGGNVTSTFTATTTVPVGQAISATATNILTGDTSEFSMTRIVLAPTANLELSGTVFEDVNYGGGPGRSQSTSSGAGRQNVSVELYDASGAFLQTTTTNIIGAYSFTGLPDNTTYSIRVVNSSVSSSRPALPPGTPLAVQTFRTDAGAGTVVGVTNEVGGAVPAGQDSGPKSAGGNLNDAAIEESVTRVVVGAGVTSLPDLDFGFNFDTIVNTNDAGQGSLRQFIVNSNALGNAGLEQQGKYLALGGALTEIPAGVEASIFMIPAAALGASGVAAVSLTSALPVVTDDFTWIDGTTQTANVGDTNAGTLGAGGTVGVDNLTLPTVPRPEVELRDGASVLVGLTIDASDAAVRGLAVSGFDSTNVLLTAFGDRAVIEQNVLGSGAIAFVDPGPAARSGDSNLRGINASDAVVRSNLIGFAAGHGVWPQLASPGWRIEENEIRSNALVNEAFDGVEVNASTTTVVQGNLVVDSGGNAVDLLTASDTTVANNTVTGNGRGNEETAGIAVRRTDSTNNTVSSNVVAANIGPGVLVTDSSVGNVISRNSTFTNGGRGIDLALSGVTGDGVTLNDPGDADSGSNDLQNFPVITNVRQGSTIVDFTLNSTANRSFRIEFFSSTTPDPTTFGEGQTFIGSQDVTTDGSGDVTSTFTATATVSLGQVITATATDLLLGNTSEFSKARIVVAATAVDEVFASAFRLQSRSQEVVALEWRTGFEIDNLGFNIYREVDGKRSLLTPQPLAGSALFAGRAALTAGKPYRWIDPNPVPNSHYWLEEIDLKAGSSLHGPFFPQPGVALDAAEADSLTSSPSIDSLQISDDDAALISEGPPEALDQSATLSNRLSKVSRKAQDPGISLLAAKSPVDPAGLPALKLAVSRDGWYRISPAPLLNRGISDLDNLQLFTQGVEVPIRLAKDGFVEFYGQRLDIPSSDQRIYWLFVGLTPGLRIPQSSVAPPSQSGPPSFAYTVERRDRTLYFSALLNGDVENIFGPLISSTAPTNQTLSLKAVDTSTSASVEVTVQGVTDAAHSVTVSLAGTQLGAIQFNGRVNRKASFTISPGALVEGNNVVVLKSSNGSSDINLVDRVRITYSRFYRAEENQLRFTVSANQPARVNGFTDQDIKLFDVTDPLRVSELLVRSTPDSPGSFAIAIPHSQNSRTFIAIGGATAGQPPVSTLNQPSSLKDRSHQADLLIISHRDFISTMAPLVALRTTQGLRVEVADVEDIYDEFSFGTYSPSAIRDFLNWTRTQWLRAPRFVLLVGDSTWDPRNYLALGPADFVPTRLIDTALMETASDDWFVDFNSDALPEMAVGRLPVRTASQCDIVVRKLVAHDSAPADPQRKAIFVADNGFQSINDELRALLPASLPVQTINRGSGSDAEVRAQILTALNSGPRLVNYTGHGSVTVWTGAGLLNSADAPALTNSNRLPLILMLTCLNSYSHDANIQSLGEALLLAPNGASAVWSSTGMTFPEPQRQIAVRLFQQLPAASGRIGEIMMQTKSATSDLDVRRTWILLGDPSMQFRLVPGGGGNANK